MIRRGRNRRFSKQYGTAGLAIREELGYAKEFLSDAIKLRDALEELSGDSQDVFTVWPNDFNLLEVLDLMEKVIDGYDELVTDISAEL